MIDGRKIFDQPVRNNLRTYDSIQIVGLGQGDNYKTGSLLDYSHFKDYYKMVTINLSKQQALNADPNSIQQINFTGSLDQGAGATMFFIIEEAKDTILDFSQGTVGVL